MHMNCQKKINITQFTRLNVLLTPSLFCILCKFKKPAFMFMFRNSALEFLLNKREEAATEKA